MGRTLAQGASGPEFTSNKHNRSCLRQFLQEFGDRRVDSITKAEGKRVACSPPGTGCRPGELAGMRWDDLKFNEVTVRVERQRRP
jgi:integrase